VGPRDSTGALRIRRLKGLVTTYYRYRGTWVRLQSDYAPGAAHLLFGVNAGAEQFGRQPAVVAFDNFQATADSVACTGFPLPPRRTRS
jgi:hypothetical protein